MSTIWTIGHSTRPIEDLISILKSFDIEQVVDVRTVPRSRWNPQFNKDQLERVLPEAGVAYQHAKDLGGLRSAKKDSINMGWRNESFRGFADYMQTPEFEEALNELMHLAKEKRTIIMCAEILPWRCHRSLIADALTVRSFEVVEVQDQEKSQPHKMTQFAVVEDSRITYPPGQNQEKEEA